MLGKRKKNISPNLSWYKVKKSSWTNPRLHRNVKFPQQSLGNPEQTKHLDFDKFSDAPLIVAGPYSPECLTKEAAHLRSAKRFVHGRDLASHSPLRPKRPIDPEIIVISALVTQSKWKHLENNISSSWDSVDEKNFNPRFHSRHPRISHWLICRTHHLSCQVSGSTFGILFSATATGLAFQIVMVDLTKLSKLNGACF